MNRTKKIYFLAAFVMIIGCYALNKSYSLFVATEEQEVVSAKVSTLEASLSFPTITLSSNEECLIKQTINNTSDVPINYSLSSTGTNYEVKITTDEKNTVIGFLEPNTSSVIYLYIKNKSSEENEITFNLNKKYVTLYNDLTSNINMEDKYTPVILQEIPYRNERETLKYKIIYNYINSNLYTTSTSSTTAEEIFKNKNENKVELPIYSGKIEIPKLETINNLEMTEKGLYQATDDYGTTYYFRGASTKNYMSFAGQIWRIVRINGDGSIRIILDSIADMTKYNSNYNDNAYIGYMYGMTGQTASNVNQCIKINSTGTQAEVDTTKTTQIDCESVGYKWAATPYDATHVNVVSSTIKGYLENWYKTNIIDTNNADYIADTLFCNDKTLATDEIGDVTDQLGYGINKTYYSSVERLYWSTGTTSIIEAKPTFECAKGVNNTYSRFTSNSTETTKGVKVNNDLTYPIGLLTADELSYAGAYKYNQVNKSYYLYNSSINSNWWLMSPSGFNGTYATKWYVYYSDGTMHHANFLSSLATRPVINLKTSVLINDGDGTKENPYTVKLS